MKKEQHNFSWAMEQLKRGNKIRRRHWHKNFFLKMHFNGKICEMNSNKAIPLKYQTTQGKDWEIFEEDKRRWMVALKSDDCIILHRNSELEQYRHMKRVSDKLIMEIK